MDSPLKNLVQLLGVDKDEEKERIIKETSQEAYEKIKALSDGNELALDYLVEIWERMFSGFRKKNINPAQLVIPKILRILADTLEKRQTRLDELRKSRDNQAIKASKLKDFPREH